MRLLHMVTAVTCVTTITAFSMPHLEDITSIFSNLMGSKNKEDSHERVKRQDTGIGDESQYPYEVKSSNLPSRPGKWINDRYMPALSNGQLSVVVYNDTMYMNGLYNGAGGESHRAKIPALMMSRVRLSNDEQERKAIRKFHFNARDGTWMETIDCEFAYIEHRVYVHARQIRLLVSDIYARKKDGIPGGGIIHLQYPDLYETDDIHFQTRQAYYDNWKVSGSTKTAESGSSTQTIHVYYQQQLTQIPVRGTTAITNQTMIMAVDRQEANAKTEFDYALNLVGQQSGSHKLLMEHVNAWRSVWDQGLIEVEGDTPVAKTTWMAQYYIMSSLPPLAAATPPQHSEILYGVGRGTLGRGRQGKDYQGHVMWDSEMYTLPAVLLFHPELAKKMLRYRSTMAGAAKTNAEAHNDMGYRFPWESARSGQEVTPPNTCDACKDRQIHNNGAIAWAIRQYYSATGDRDYTTNPDYNGCDMTRELAKFYAHRAVYNSSKARYDIKDVMGPDDWHDHVDNNAYTNALASLAIHWARYFACICNRNEREEVPDEWIQKALYLHLPFDNEKRVHYQYEGYENSNNNTIKQADATLLTFPLNWNMSHDIMRNDLLYYEQRISPRTPSMTHSFMTVGFKVTKEEALMNSYFMKSFQDYTISPFRIWTEYNEASLADQDTGAVNFVPGMAAFLQSLVYGFGGIRIRPETLEFHDPKPPPGCTVLRLRHLNYQGADFTFEIFYDKVDITVHSIAQVPLVLRRNQTSNSQEESLTPGAYITIQNSGSGFFIYSNQGSACEHPRDYIYMPWGYSPFINSGNTRDPTPSTVRHTGSTTDPNQSDDPTENITAATMKRSGIEDSRIVLIVFGTAMILLIIFMIIVLFVLRFSKGDSYASQFKQISL